MAYLRFDNCSLAFRTKLLSVSQSLIKIHTQKKNKIKIIKTKSLQFIFSPCQNQPFKPFKPSSGSSPCRWSRWTAACASKRATWSCPSRPFRRCTSSSSSISITTTTTAKPERRRRPLDSPGVVVVVGPTRPPAVQPVKMANGPSTTSTATSEGGR